jgi:hypothetical protein
MAVVDIDAVVRTDAVVKIASVGYPRAVLAGTAGLDSPCGLCYKHHNLIFIKT